MTNEKFRQLALSFEGTVEAPHFDRRAFKVIKKRTYATLHEPSRSANVKLPLIEQSVFCCIDKNKVFAIPNKWGLQGWTTFKLPECEEGIIVDALEVAYNEVIAISPKKRK